MRSGHRDEARARAGALSPAHRGAPREGPLPEVREAPARAASKPVRGLRREAAARRPRTVPPTHQQYHERRADGLCTRCGGPVLDGLSRCAPCTVIDERSRSPQRKNARSRKLYAERRARGLCTSCGVPSHGGARCAPCAEHSYHRSDHFRGIPVWDPSFTVIELDTGRELGTFDSEADVALCLVFEKLHRDQVEVLSDASPMSSFTAWT